MSFRISPLLGMLIGVCLVGPAGVAEDASVPQRADWPQWRGPSRTSIVEGEPWPTSLDEGTLKAGWRNSLGPGYSGPIVTSDRIFVTETDRETDEIVRALDRKTGAEIWRASWKGALKVPFFARENGDWIRATPAIDGDALYVAGIRDLLVCLEQATGKERWRVDFVERDKASIPAFGFVSSPLVTEDALYVQAGGAFQKLDKQTGATLWKTLDDGGGMGGSAFSSPFLTTINGIPQILVQTRNSLAGVDPETGRVFWKTDVPAFRGMNILTPTVYANSVFTSSYGGKSTLFNISLKDSEQSVSTAWENKTQGYMSSPIVLEDYAYLHLKNQRFTCIDLRTGKETWTTTPYGKYWSMVARGDTILALDERGDLYLIRANPEKFELLSSRKVSESPTWGHVAVAGNEIFIRELHAIAAWEWK